MTMRNLLAVIVRFWDPLLHPSVTSNWMVYSPFTSGLKSVVGHPEQPTLATLFAGADATVY
jgi:hypothetical protein